MDSKIQERIMKLIALAENNPNGAEAQSAMAKANALMQEHGFTDMDLRMSQIEEILVKSKFSISKPKDWEVSLAIIIGDAFGCRVMWREAKSWYSDNYGRFIYVGAKDQVKLAVYCCEVMMRGIAKGRSKFNSDLTKNYPFLLKDQRAAQLNGYCWGYVNGVFDKMHKFKNPSALDLLLEDMINKSTKKAEDGEQEETKVKKSGELGRIGYERGANEIKETDIHRPMNAGVEQVRIGGAA